MAKSKEFYDKESKAERLSRWGRNFNALGALAIGGAAVVIPGPNVILASWAAINGIQAGGFEWLRKKAKKKRRKNESN